MTRTDPEPRARLLPALAAGAAGLLLLAAAFLQRGWLPPLRFISYPPLGIWSHLLLFLPGAALLGWALGPWVPLARLRAASRGILRLSPTAFAAVVFLVILVEAGAMAWVVFDGIPHIQDSITHVFQARVYATGRLWVPAPPLEDQEFYDTLYILMHQGRWFGKYPPFLPALLTLGLLAGVPWLVNPLLAALTTVLVYRLGAAMFGEGVGRGAALLAVVSPFFLGLAGSYMSHPASMLLFTLAATGWWRSRADPRVRWLLLIGAAVGAGLLCRPFSTVAFSLPIGANLAWGALRGRRSFRSLLPVVLPVLLGIALFLAYNGWTTGDPLVTGYALWDPGDRPGFGPDRGHTHVGGGKPPGHTPLKMLDNIRIFLLLANESLLGWPSFSLAPLAAALWLRRRSPGARLLGASFASITVLHGLHWCSCTCMGPRYLYDANAAILILTSLGLGEAYRALRTRRGRAALLIFLVPMFARAGLRYWPRMLEEYSDSYWNVDTELRDQVREWGLADAIVFVESSFYERMDGFSHDYFGAAILLNDLDLQGPVLYVRDLSEEENAAFASRHPGRSTYRFRYGRMKYGRPRPGEPMLEPYPVRSSGPAAAPP